MTETLAGLVLMWWDALSQKQRDKAARSLLESAWGDQRPAARSLAYVAVSSLPRETMASIADAVQTLIATRGIPEFDLGVFALAVAHLASDSAPQALDTIEEWRTSSRPVEGDASDDSRRTDRMLLSMTLAGQEHTLYRAAIASIGIPRRKRWHHGIYDVLAAELEREDLDPNTSSRALRELGVLLEPLQLLIQQNSYLIESPLLSKPLLEHIAFIQRPRYRYDECAAGPATERTRSQPPRAMRAPTRSSRRRCRWHAQRTGNPSKRVPALSSLHNRSNPRRVCTRVW